MPNLNVVNMSGEKVGEIELSDSVFGCEINGAVLHSAVRAYLLNQRQGTQSALTRAEVSGGGIKPWRQKGSGRARQGSRRAPQWTHGGIVFAPKPRSYHVTLNKKTKRVAMKSALSSKVAAGEMIVIDNISAEEFKTRTMVNMLKAIGADKKALVVLANNDEKTVKSFANIPGAKTAQFNTINVYDILNCGKFVVVESAAKKIEEVYAQ